MNDFEDGVSMGIAFGLAVMAAFAAFLYWGIAKPAWHQAINDHGCAEYYLDDDSKRQWRWTVPEEKSE